jgi:phosphoadenylyl-sulfate reductase (thioredoxin)
MDNLEAPAALPAQDLMAWAIERYGDRFSVVTSFQAEGMILIDMAVRVDPKVRIQTIDTGRLPEETYQLMDAVRERYRVGIEIVYPDNRELERMTMLHGVNLFYREPLFRRLCCHVRKVRPLDRALRGIDAWATGLRTEQSEERASVAKVAQSAGRLKLSPLADWTLSEVEGYMSANGLLRHPLAAKGYRSIGCAPCTRAVQPGESDRAGRWWWEEGMSKECGLHAAPSGTLRRSLDVLLDDILSN